jgi:hypothetical protein
MSFSSRLTSVGLVVLATNNNPRLLNPDFLKRNKIVPDDWEVNDVLVTPPFAQTAFKNGLTIQLIENRFVVEVGTPNQIDWASLVPDIATKFLVTLPHVDYGAIGMNFGFASEKPVEGDAEKHLINNLLKPGSWDDQSGGLSGAVIELRYRFRQPQINIKIGVKDAPTPQGKKAEEYLVSVNVHHDFVREQDTEREGFIRKIENNYREAESLVSQLPLDA